MEAVLDWQLCKLPPLGSRLWVGSGLHMTEAPWMFALGPDRRGCSSPGEHPPHGRSQDKIMGQEDTPGDVRPRAALAQKGHSTPPPHSRPRPTVMSGEMCSASTGGELPSHVANGRAVAFNPGRV